MFSILETQNRRRQITKLRGESKPRRNLAQDAWLLASLRCSFRPARHVVDKTSPTSKNPIEDNAWEKVLTKQIYCKQEYSRECKSQVGQRAR